MARNPSLAYTVRVRSGRGSAGVLIRGPRAIPVMLGRGGIRAGKREGDGATPRGCYHPVRVWYRADKGLRPRTGLPIRTIRPDDGWCDDSGHRAYNRWIRLPFRASHERLWRDDDVYDLVVELDHNSRPRVRGRGSAVFIHLTRPDRRPTAGCIALTPPELRLWLARLTPKSRIVIR